MKKKCCKPQAMTGGFGVVKLPQLFSFQIKKWIRFKSITNFGSENAEVTNFKKKKI